MTTPAPAPVYGEFVYVRHLVGNPYGSAGTTTGVEFNVDIENLIEGGYMAYAPGSVSDPYTVPLGSYGSDPLNPAPGEWVYVYHVVGTPYGAAGTVTGVEYTTHIHRLVGDGAMTLTLPPTSELQKAPLYGDNSFASLGMVKDLMYAYYGGYDGSDGDYSHLILSDRLRDAISAQMSVTYDPTVQALLTEARALNASTLSARNAAQASATLAGEHSDDVSDMRDHVDRTREHVDLTSAHVDLQATAAGAASSISTSKALESSGHAGTATTKATEAAQSRADALTYRNTAQGAASTATTQAGISTTQAGISTAQAVISTARATEAATSALTLAQRIETGTREIAYAADGRPYLLNTASVGVPLTVDTSVGTRVMLGDVMIHGDTGWRKLSDADFLNGWAAGGVSPRIRRLGDLVLMDIPGAGLSNTNATGTRFMEIPVGFRSPHNYGTPGVAVIGASTFIAIKFDLGGFLYLAGSTSTGQISGQLQWRTSNAWPTTLPGTPA